MVKLTVKFLDAGQTQTHFGSERECEEWLRTLFPRETQDTRRLLACAQVINSEGFAEVEVEPYRVPRERNLLPPDYDSDIHREDPWKREADEHDL